MHGNFRLYSSNRLGFFLAAERLETLHQRGQRRALNNNLGTRVRSSLSRIS